MSILTAAARQKTLLVKYADNISILIPFSRQGNISVLATIEIKTVKRWCGMVVNNEKKVFVWCSLHQKLTKWPSVISRELPHKYPGSHFEGSTKWDIHSERVTKNTSPSIHMQSKTMNDLLQVYQNYILNIMECNSLPFAQRMNKWITHVYDCQCSDFPKLEDR